MKYLFLLLFIPFTGNAQTSFWNTTCATAKFLCENDFGDTLESISQPGCGGGTTSFDVYYYFRTETTGSNTVLQYSSSVTTQYQVYGPYDNLDDGCADLTTVAASGASSTSYSITFNTAVNGLYILRVRFLSCPSWFRLAAPSGYKASLSNSWEMSGCTGCIPGFRPTTGIYVISAWTKDTDAQQVDTTTTYSEPYLLVSSGPYTRTLRTSGDIIDGWQRIQDTVSISSANFQLSLGCEDGDCYFDDVRIFPFDGSMVTYVYDPLTFRLMAELDDNNYAKFYEYDEDGKLIRIKKETERGIMTIQESRENNAKR